jgi:hypothetical protein
MDPAIGPPSLMPYVPLSLALAEPSLNVTGLLDTGATMSVLPNAVGLQLGAVWERQTVPVRLTGNLAQVEARAIILMASLGQFPPVRLAFAWAKMDGMPIILGQVNFFMEFDVCFYRARSVFEVRPK